MGRSGQVAFVLGGTELQLFGFNAAASVHVTARQLASYENRIFVQSLPCMGYFFLKKKNLS